MKRWSDYNEKSNLRQAVQDGRSKTRPLLGVYIIAVENRLAYR